MTRDARMAGIGNRGIASGIGQGDPQVTAIGVSDVDADRDASDLEVQLLLGPSHLPREIGQVGPVRLESSRHLAVTAVERGLEIEATLLDARTQLPLRQFAAWRGRS